jgi:hypothetical protein
MNTELNRSIQIVYPLAIITLAGKTIQPYVTEIRLLSNLNVALRTFIKSK